MPDGVIWDDHPDVVWDDPVGAARGQPTAPANIGALETYVNHFDDAVPLGKPAVNVAATGGLQLMKLLGLGDSGVKFTPGARKEMAARNLPTYEDNAIPGVLESYRNVRDEREQRSQEGAAQNPTAAMLGTGSGIAATLLAPMPSARVGSGALGSVASTGLTGAGYGGLFGLTHGSADMTKGEFRQAARDVLGVDALQAAKKEFGEGNYGRALLDFLGAGAVGGGAAGLAAGAVAQGASKVAGRARAGQELARTDQIAATGRAAEKAEASALGRKRSAIQSAHRDLEVLEKVAQGNDELAWEASAYLETPKADALRQLVGRGKLASAPERVADVTRLDKALQEASAARAPEAIAAKADEALANPIRTQVVPRLTTYLNRSIPTAVGSAIGGPGGAVVGGIVGNSIGHPGTVLARAIQSPSIRNMSWSGLRRLSELATSGSLAAGERAIAMPRPALRASAFAESDADEQQDALVSALMGRR